MRIISLVNTPITTGDTLTALIAVSADSTRKVEGVVTIAPNTLVVAIDTTLISAADPFDDADLAATYVTTNAFVVPSSDPNWKFVYQMFSDYVYNNPI